MADLADPGASAVESGTGHARTWTPIVDQHATWIALNPVQGCPKRCTYCFLNERGQTAVPPSHLVSAVESVELLLNSSFYAPRRPVALYTWTDVMALPDSRRHLAELLEELARRKAPNPIILITKCHVPDDTLATIVTARKRGLTVVVYLSYSGLGRDIERGIRHEALAENFPRLAEAGIPIVHYWRPAFPDSADPDTMRRVLDHAARYARCTIAAGLKVEKDALTRLAQVWPELAAMPEVTEAEGVYPRAFWEFIHRTWQSNPDYPAFHTNSCALAFVLDQPDSFGVFGSQVCRVRNHCPIAQRERCTVDDAQRAKLTTDTIDAALARRGLSWAPYTVVGGNRELVIDATLDTSLAAALTQDLGVRVRVRRNDADVYWSSGTAGATPVVLG